MMINKNKADEEEEEEEKEKEKLITQQQSNKPTKSHKKTTTTRLLKLSSSFFSSLFPSTSPSSSSSQKPKMDSSSSSIPPSPTEQFTFSDAAFPTAATAAVAKSRRTPSFSSSSSSSSYYEDSPSAPETPLHYSSGRVPFSWEKLPGIPKKSEPSSLKVSISDERTSDSKPSPKVLPLPPLPITPPAARRFCFEETGKIRRASTFSTSSSRFVVPRDPFFAALVECSKGEDDGGFSDDQEFLSGGGAKVTRSISDRFGFVGMYASCKRTCAVSESIVYLPRSSPARPSYDLLSRRR